MTGNRIKDGAVSETKLSPALQDTVASSAASVAERQSFYVTLDINLAEQTIATNGPLEYFVRCFINDGGSDRVEIIATSSVAGWYEEDNGSAALPALQEEIILSNSNPTGDDDYENEIDDGSMVGPDGSYMAVDGETVGLGLNIFGHRCVAVGHVIKVNGTL